MSTHDDHARGAQSLVQVAPAAVTLASGRRVETAVDEHGADVLRVRATTGECILTVRLTDEGPIFSFAAASLEISAADRLELAAREVRLRAKEDARIDVGGSLTERVAGDVVRCVEGRSASTARALHVEASPGGILLRANDDIEMRGERIRLNPAEPPPPLPMEQFRQDLDKQND